MKTIRLFLLFLLFFSKTSVFSQLSGGGLPFFLQPSILRTSSGSFFLEMPAFNLDSVLREDALNEKNRRESYRFAHKFYTRIEKKRDAVLTQLPDGTKVWQIGIRSEGAYSINLLLKDFEIPEGGRLFVYNTNHSYIIGSFDYRNNSTEKILPIRPVAGDAIIVEYSEPANVPFEGNFTITEVNHDYRDFLKSEPDGNDNNDYACMPNVFCSNAAEETIRSTVLLIINGNTRCTGSLINNTSDNGQPYLLTSVHCLANPAEFPKNKDYYNDKAGTIITFFNYNRPVCNPNIKMKGSEEMSVAGAYARAIIEKKDIALLELKNDPPDYFNAYYAGWNRDLGGREGRHTNIHHPSGVVKKYGMTERNVELVSYPMYFDANSHWYVPSWTIGSTHGGSSGSPLFDRNNLIIGGLSGGSSTCQGSNSDGNADYFFALGKGWETIVPENQLKTYLDPLNSDLTQHPGMDPHRTNPLIRLANANYKTEDALITSRFESSSSNNGYIFGNSNLQTREFAEEFSIAGGGEIFGTYLLLPAMSSAPFPITVSVYSGNTSPENKIYTTSFIPQYWNYTSALGFHLNDKSMNVPTESFVAFDSLVLVNKKFFVSYTINDLPAGSFCVYNTTFGNSAHPNTAWLKDETGGWVPAVSYTHYPLKTSLAIHPLMRNRINNTIETPNIGKNKFYYNQSNHTIVLLEPFNEPGFLEVYSISGQLLEKKPVQQGETVIILSKKSKGTIGIVKITSVNSLYTGKIMY